MPNDAAAVLLARPTPVPTPTGNVDPDSVTPGFVGFLITFLIAVVTLLLIIDMVRRIRRQRYRAEIDERLDAEEAELRAAGTHPDQRGGEHPGPRGGTAPEARDADSGPAGR